MNTKIKEFRLGAGLSQAELGERVGVSQVLVSNWERGVSDPNERQEASLRRVLGYGADSVAGSPLAAWVSKARLELNLSVPELAYKANLTPPAVYRIESGVTRNLRATTQKKLEKALGSKLSEEAADEVAEEASVIGLGALEDFDPHVDSERPAQSGIYVLYDISERPVYVGEGGNVKKRIRDHEEKFWFKRPVVESASWIKVENAELRKQVETILIKFLKSNAVINKQNVER